MPRYHHRNSYHQQTKFLHKTRRFVLWILGLVLLAGLILLVDSKRESVRSTQPSAPTQEISANFSPPIEVFQTPYFQFQTGKGWKLVTEESTGSKFVYRKFSGTLVEHEVDVHVNDPAFKQSATRTLPLKVNSQNRLEPMAVSEHCKKVISGPIPGTPKVVTVSEVQFLCNPSGVEYQVVAGMQGGSSAMKLTRPDGSSAVYHIVYNNVKYSPDEREFVKIIDTFHTR